MLFLLFLVLFLSLSTYSISRSIKEYHIRNIKKNFTINEEKNHDNILNIDRNKNVIAEINERVQNSSRRINYCSKYKEPYGLHFIKPPKWKDTNSEAEEHLIQKLFNFTPLFDNYTLKTSNKLLYIKDIAEIGEYRRSELSSDNFYHNLKVSLDLNLKLYAKGQISYLNMNITLPMPIKHVAGHMYMMAVSLFFDPSQEFLELDNIIFDIIVPFRNKLNCMLFDEEKQKFCKKCLNLNDVDECCSYESYDIQAKKQGQVFLKNAVWKIHNELREYIMAVNSNATNEDIHCFYDKMTLKLCRLLHHDF